MSCSTSIVECLRDKNIEPKVYSSSELQNSYKAEYSLVYNKNNIYHTEREKKHSGGMSISRALLLLIAIK